MVFSIPGMVKELDVHKNEYATKFLISHSTYILVQKEILADESSTDGNSTPTPHFQYVPLLEKYAELFPSYKLHVQEVEKKKPRRTTSKSPSPAGRFKSIGKSKKTLKRK